MLRHLTPMIGDTPTAPTTKRLLYSVRYPTSSLILDGTTNGSLVRLDDARQARPGVADHPFTKPVQHEPCGAIRAQTQLTLKLKSADPRREGGHQIRRPKPLLNGYMRAVHQCARYGRGLFAAAPADQ